MSIDDFFAEHATPDVKKRYKTAAAKKGWVVNATRPPNH